MKFISNNRDQINMFGYTLNDLVPQKAKCKLIITLIKKLKLKKLYHRYSSQGNHAYDPSMMLATWFLSYCEKETSTRKLEELCQRDLHFMYISSNLQPDHTSLARFRQANIDLMTEYFTQLVLLIKKKKIAEFKDIAIDGSKIQASCSKSKNRTEDGLSKQIRKVEEQIKSYMAECDTTERIEAGDIPTINKKIKQLKKEKKKLLKHQRELIQRRKKLKKEHRNNHRINLTEPDAFNMNHVNGSNKLPAYNSQISVDTKTQIIAANDVVQDRNDTEQFEKQHKNVEKNLGQDVDREYTTDSGYHSLEQLEYIERNKIKAIVADKNPKNRCGNKNYSQEEIQDRFKGKKRIERSDFIYHKEDDYYECPAGQRLLLDKKITCHGRSGFRYRCYDCIGCRYYNQCIPKKKKIRYRQITRDDHEYLAEQMYIKTKTEYGKQKLKQRAYSVEGVFGNIKENLGFRRFRLRGLTAVRGEFNLMCIAYNINKIHILFFYYFYLALYRIFKERINIFTKVYSIHNK